MSDRAVKASAVIIGDAGLKRAGLVFVLEDWARALDLEIDTVSPAELDAYAARPRDLKLIILTIGGDSLNEPAARELVARITALFVAVPCILISDRSDSAEAVTAAKLSLRGFLSTTMEPALAARALTFVLGGGTYFPREALLQLNPARAQANRAEANGIEEGALTRRQIEVVGRLRLGHSNKQIARDLSMQESTVKVHIRQIMNKLGAANRTQAALLAVALAARAQKRETEEQVNGQADADREAETG